MESDRDGKQGYYHSETLTIGICDDLSKNRQKEVILHEILHAIHDFWRLGDESKEEEYADCTATGLLMVFKDNPKLFKQLIGE